MTPLRPKNRAAPYMVIHFLTSYYNPRLIRGTHFFEGEIIKKYICSPNFFRRFYKNRPDFSRNFCRLHRDISITSLKTARADQPSLLRSLRFRHVRTCALPYMQRLKLHVRKSARPYMQESQVRLQEGWSAVPRLQ